MGFKSSVSFQHLDHDDVVVVARHGAAEGLPVHRHHAVLRPEHELEVAAGPRPRRVHRQHVDHCNGEIVIIVLIISLVTTTALNTGLRGPLSGSGLLWATRGCPKIKKTEKVFHHQKFWCLPKFLLITRVSD